MNLVKKILISFVFDFIWEQIICFIRIKVRNTDNKYDDKFVDWIDGLKVEARQHIKMYSK